MSASFGTIEQVGRGTEIINSASNMAAKEMWHPGLARALAACEAMPKAHLHRTLEGHQLRQFVLDVGVKGKFPVL
jgi:hypothetical protein